MISRLCLSCLIAAMAASPLAVAAEHAASANAAALVAAHDDPNLPWGACPDFMPAGCRIAVLQGDPAMPNADIFFRVPGGAVIPRHWHTSAERMVLLAGEIHVDYAGQPTAVLRPGRYAYGPPRHVHDARCVSGDACVLFIAFELPVDAIAGEPEKNE